MAATLVLGLFVVILGVANGIAQYRYVRLGSPATVHWRLLLFVLGAILWPASGWLLLTVLNITPSENDTEKEAVFMVALITAILGGLAHTWLAPQGMRRSLEMADKNRIKRE